MNSSVNEIRMCPATIFAVSRTDRVIGRIMFLVSSISTIRGIRGIGVPIGTKCASLFLVFIIKKNIIDPLQTDRAIGKFTEICAVGPKVEGIKDQAFITVSPTNKVVIILLVSEVLIFFIEISLSLDRADIGAMAAILAFDLEIDFVIVIANGAEIISQLVLIIEFDGSNIEKSPVIIVICFLLLLFCSLFCGILSILRC